MKEEDFKDIIAKLVEMTNEQLAQLNYEVFHQARMRT